MGPVMLAHVNEFLCLGGTAESGLAYGLRFSYKSDYGAVGGLSGIHVQHFDALYGLDGRHNGVDNTPVAPFAIVGNTFYKLFHGFSFNASIKVGKLLEIAKEMITFDCYEKTNDPLGRNSSFLPRVKRTAV